MNQILTTVYKMITIVAISLISIQYTFGQLNKELVERPIKLICDFKEMQVGDSLRIVAKLNKFGFSGIFDFCDTIVDKNLRSLIVGAVSQPGYLQIRVDSIKAPRNAMMLMTQSFLVEPGDTIFLQKGGLGFSISGKSKGLKYLQEISKIGTSLYNKRWHGENRIKPTIEDYLYLDSITFLELSFLESIKSKISDASYAITKLNLLSGNQTRKRIAEKNLSNSENRFKLPVEVIGKINPQFPNYEAIRRCLLGYRDSIESQLLQFVENSKVYLPYSISYSSFLEQKYLIDSCIGLNRNYDFLKHYNDTKREYRGLLREKLIAQLVTRNIRETVDIAYVVKDVLEYCDDIEFKKYFLSLEAGTNGKMAYMFELPDLMGNIIKLDSLKGKVVVLDLWFTGCVNCVAIHPIFESVVDHFSNNSNVIFVSINVDSEQKKWINSVLKGDGIGRYTSVGKHNLLNLYTGGKGEDHPMISYHIVKGYPTLIIVNPKGEIEQTPVDLRKDNGTSLIGQIRNILAKQL